MIVFISGGCKNGKSTLAENIAVKLSKKDNTELYYIATMIPHDEEDEIRIKRHKEARKDKNFTTIEEGFSLGKLFEKYQKGTFLLDSVTAYLSNLMFLEDGSVDELCEKKAEKELYALAKGAENIVFVSDFLYSDATNYENLTEKYRQNLAYVDKSLARLSDLVIEVCSSNALVYKGNLDELD